MSVSQPLVNVVDSAAMGAVTPVKNREQCDSCWAFSTTSSLEGDGFIVTVNMLPSSEQQLAAIRWMDSACNGGLVDNGLAFDNKSTMCTETCYPLSRRRD